MDMKIKGRWALVTGGANGIGASISEALAKEGANVVFTSRHKSTISKMTNHLSSFDVESHGIVVDFLECDWVERFLSEIANFKIDILINNAGHNLNVVDPYCSIKDWRRVLALNFETAVVLCNAIIPGMKLRNWGRIVNITSCAGLENMGPVTYGVAKSALTVYSRTMGRILATECPNVVMTAVFPGVVLTDGGHWDNVLKSNPEHAERYLRERCPLGRFGKVDEISPVVVFYASELASFSHGAIIPVDAGQSRNYMYHNFM